MEPGLARGARAPRDIDVGRRGLRSGNGMAGSATACWVAPGAGEEELAASCGSGAAVSVCGEGLAGAAGFGLRSGRGTFVLLAMLEDFAFEAAAFLPLFALACFEADFADVLALIPAGVAVAPPPMKRQAMHASNGRVLAQKRLMRRPVPVLRSRFRLIRMPPTDPRAPTTMLAILDGLSLTMSQRIRRKNDFWTCVWPGNC